MFSISSERKTRTLTLTYLERDVASGDRKRDLNEQFHDPSGGADETLYRTRVFSACMHCALTVATNHCLISATLIVRVQTFF